MMLLRAAVAALLLAAGLNREAAAQGAPAASAAQDFSAAERLLFMDDQLGNVKPPATLGYTLRRTGSLEPGYDDRIALALKTGVDGRCCATHTDFLTGQRRLELPDLPAATGNPVILHFLEREVREMQRLTRGSQTHFRKRIRMAVYGAATVAAVKLRYRGRLIDGTEVSFSPYLDDPNRPRYDELARKEYRFVFSDAVPGRLYAIRTRVPGTGSGTGSVPLLAEDLSIDGAESTQTETR